MTRCRYSNKDPNFSRKVDTIIGFKTNSIIAVPLIVEDNIYGVIEIINRIDKIPFTEEEHLILKSVANFAAIALKNYTPATMVLDAPLTFRDSSSESSWKPKNFGKKYKGEVTVREAVMRSMNVPTLNVMADVGAKNVIDWAKKIGIDSKLKLGEDNS